MATTGFAAARDAFAPSGPVSSPVGVLPGERVALVARVLRSTPRITASKVLRSGHRFHVTWPDTRPGPTQVVQIQAIRDRAHREFVDQAVCSLRRAFAMFAEPAVTVGRGVAGPKPASVTVLPGDLGPETRYPVGARWRHGYHGTYDKDKDEEVKTRVAVTVKWMAKRGG